MQASADPWRDGCSGQIGTSLVRVLKKGTGKGGAWRDGNSKRRRQETLGRAWAVVEETSREQKLGVKTGEWRLLDIMDRDSACHWDC